MSKQTIRHCLFCCKLVQTLANKGHLSGDEPYTIFNNAKSTRITQGQGGEFTAMCLGNFCGNDAAGGDFGNISLNLTQEQLDSSFKPTRADSRSGWVAVEQKSHTPLSVVLQLAQTLHSKNLLTSGEPYDIFDVTPK